jgi:CubicO group peptidase (beta-lactamase class C family)
MHFFRILSPALLAAGILCQFVADVRAEAPKSQGNPQIAAALQPFVDRHELAGAVALVATKDKVLSVDTVGYADVGAKTPIKADGIFWIASMSKPITGAAVMMLVDEGKISLDDPVEKYLPEFKGQMVVVEKDADHVLLKKPVHPITVRNVLSHTSGLDFKTPLEDPTLDMQPLRDRVRGYAMSPLLFQPDSNYKYSNAGINTAARILEVVSGMSYEEFMDKRLFAPLGMKDTTFWPSGEQLTRIVKAYKPDASKSNLEETTVTQLRYPLDDRKNRHPMPAGGLFSTAADVNRFCQMVLNGGELDGKRYLTADAVKQLTSRQTPAELKTSYGLGWAVAPDNSGHGGAYATNMSIYQEKGLITVWMVQHAGFPGDGKKAQEAFKQAALASLPEKK